LFTRLWLSDAFLSISFSNKHFAQRWQIKSFNQRWFISDIRRSFNTTWLLLAEFFFSSLDICQYFSITHVQLSLRYATYFLDLTLDMPVIIRLHNLFKIHFNFVPPIVIPFMPYALFYLGTIRHFSWNNTYLSQWRFHDNRCINTSLYVSKFQISQFLCSKLHASR
jgi:hypothetical protein